MHSPTVGGATVGCRYRLSSSSKVCDRPLRELGTDLLADGLNN